MFTILFYIPALYAAMIVLFYIPALYAAMIDKDKDTLKEDVAKKNATTDPDCCECPKTKKELEQENNEQMMMINFQDYLQTFVYIKR